MKECYLTVLDRPADRGGLDYWSNWLSTHKRHDILTARLAGLGEFTSTHPTNASYVNALYRIAFGRQADESGRTFWVRRLATGTSRYSVALSMLHLSEAGRYQARRAYQAVLGRAATTPEASFVAADYTELEYDPAEIRVRVLATVDALGVSLDA